MPTKDVLINIKTNARQAQKQFSSLNAGVAKLGAALGIAFGVGQLVQFGKEAVILASKAEGVRTAFARLNEPELLKNLRIATRNTVTDFELMKTAMRASNFKIPLGQLATLLKFAKDRATQTGESVEYLVNSIVDGIGRKSTLVLDNLGISATELQKEVKKIGDFGQATGNIVSRELAKMGNTADTTADKMLRIQTALDNFKETAGALGIEAASGIEKFYTSITSFFDRIKTKLEEPGGFRDSFLQAMGITTLKMMIGSMNVPRGPYSSTWAPAPPASSGGGGWVDPRTATGISRRGQKGYGSTQDIAGHVADTAFGILTATMAKANVGGLLGLRGVKPELRTEPIITESEARQGFREFSIIADETARTLYTAFSSAWEDIFGKANSLFEQLLQNIGLGLMDAFAQDISSSIFSSLIPGGGILDSLFGTGGKSSGGSATLVQIDGGQLEKATTRSVPNVLSQMEARRIT